MSINLSPRFYFIRTHDDTKDLNLKSPLSCVIHNFLGKVEIGLRNGELMATEIR